MTDRLYFEDVEVGQEIPSFVRQTHFHEWNRYAAVNYEFVPIHMDDDAGKAAGNKQGAFGMGNLRLSYLRNMLTTWIGDDAEIRELGIQYRGINQKKDVLTCVGEVTEKSVEDGEHRVHLKINVIDQDGKATAPGHAIVVLPSRS